MLTPTAHRTGNGRLVNWAITATIPDCAHKPIQNGQVMNRATRNRERSRAHRSIATRSGPNGN